MKLFKKFSKKRYNIGIGTDIAKTAIVDPHSTVGKYTFIGDNSGVTKTVIGNYCSIGSSVTIGPGEHPITEISTSHLFLKGNPYEEFTQKDCIIGNDVWIGTGSIIRRGVKIGNGAVIGANSFVNKDVPDFAVVAGNPARVIKYRFNEETQKRILETKWWDKDLDEARKIIESINIE